MKRILSIILICVFATSLNAQMKKGKNIGSSQNDTKTFSGKMLNSKSIPGDQFKSK